MSNFTEYFPNYGKLKQEFQNWLHSEFEFIFFITANFNRETTPQAGRAILSRWLQKMERKLFGKYYWKKRNEDRIFFIAFPEIGGQTNQFHYHILLNLPINRKNDFLTFAPKFWENNVLGGTLDVNYLENELDVKKTVNYSSKDLWQPNNYNNFIVSTEFRKKQ